MDFLLVEGLRNLQQAFVVVTLVSEKSPNECTKCVDTQAQFEVVVRGWAWGRFLTASYLVELGRVGGCPPCLLKVLDRFHLLGQLGVACEDGDPPLCAGEGWDRFPRVEIKAHYVLHRLFGEKRGLVDVFARFFAPKSSSYDGGT